MNVHILDFANICRTCLKADKSMRSLFPDDTDEANEMQEILRMIENVVDYADSNAKSFPNNICTECIGQLRASYDFKAQCERSFEVLSSILDTCTSGLKQEPALVFIDAQAKPENLKEEEEENEHDALQELSGEYNCAYCTKSFRQEVHLRKHVATLHANVENTCNFCDKQFVSAAKLNKHIAANHPESFNIKCLLKCENCEEEFETEEALDEHPCSGDISFDPTNVVEILGLDESRTPKKRVLSDDDNDDPDYEGFNDQDSDDDDDSGDDDKVPLSKLLNTTPSPKKGKKKSKKKSNANQSPKGNDDAKTNKDNRCDVCSKTFKRASHLKRHKVTHMDEKPFSCNICHKGFSRADHLRAHSYHHENVKPFVCSNCDRGFFTAERLKRHTDRNFCDKDKNPAPKTEFCKICNKGFTTTKYLAIHERTHTDRKWNCKHCPETFTTKKDLQKHNKDHSIETERPFLCSECGLRFVRNDYLIIHMRRHKGEKPYKCKFCGKGFPRATDLNVHERYHTGVKTHLCTTCGKGFHRAYNLLVHTRVHTGEKPYKCPHCSKSFAQGNDLKSHIRRHTGERFKCEICEEGFIQGYHLTQHKRNAHGIDTQSHIKRVAKFTTPTEQEKQMEAMKQQTKPTEEEMVEHYLQIEIKQEVVGI